VGREGEGEEIFIDQSNYV